MKTQFYLGMGLGIAAAASAVMLMKPKKNCVERTIHEARQAVDSAAQKFM
jgi:gas vesicle protein